MTGEAGLFTGLFDVEGSPIHLGDTLSFCENALDSEFDFVIGVENGSLDSCGALNDLAEWCTITKKWDGKNV